MGRMHELGLLDCEDRPSIEENFARIKESGGDPVLDENGKLLNEVLPDGYPYAKEYRYTNSGYKEGDELDGTAFFKVSDDVIPYKDIIGGMLNIMGKSDSVTDSMISFPDPEKIAIIEMANIFFVYQDGYTLTEGENSVTFPSVGVYMMTPKIIGPVEFSKSFVETMNIEYLSSIVITKDANGDYGANCTYQKARNAVLAGVPVVINDESVSTIFSMTKVKYEESSLDIYANGYHCYFNSDDTVTAGEI